MNQFLLLQLSGLAKGKAFIDLHQIAWVKEFVTSEGDRLSTMIKMSGEIEPFSVEETLETISQAIMKGAQA